MKILCSQVCLDECATYYACKFSRALVYHVLCLRNQKGMSHQVPLDISVKIARHAIYIRP